jgi:hypothetical protein
MAARSRWTQIIVRCFGGRSWTRCGGSMGTITQNWETKNMKTLLATAALAAVIASPAFAQTGTRSRVQAAEHPSQYDQQVGREEAQPRSGMQANPVYDNNHYLGADPDPNVRLDLRRDFEGRDF